MDNTNLKLRKLSLKLRDLDLRLRELCQTWVNEIFATGRDMRRRMRGSGRRDLRVRSRRLCATPGLPDCFVGRLIRAGGVSSVADGSWSPFP